MTGLEIPNEQRAILNTAGLQAVLGKDAATLELLIAMLKKGHNIDLQVQSVQI